MPLVPLTPVLDAALSRGGAALGMVCLSWEDAEAFVAAGEAEGIPIILSAGPGARAAIPLRIWGEMFRTLADQASIPVVAHLDHGHSLEDCETALDAGFSSVMFDGSELPLDENISITQKVVALAHKHGASTEGEVGVVGYAGGAASAMTAAQDAARFANETQVDCLAISVGNVHLTPDHSTPLNWDRLTEIRTATSVPLVIHGGSGVPPDNRARAAREFSVCKINLGTEIRQAYGSALRDVLAKDHHIFDRLAIARGVREARAPFIRKVLRDAWA